MGDESDPDALRTRLLEDAIVQYGRVLGIVEPIRLRYLSELGLTLAQLRILGTLAEQPGLSLRDLAAALGVTPSTVSQQMNRLVRHGLVTRQENLNDRRFLRHTLSDGGVNAIDEVRRAARARLWTVLSGLSSSELEDVIRGLQRLSDAAGPVRTEPVQNC